VFVCCNFESKTSRQSRKVKNSAIVLKFGTIVDWMNKSVEKLKMAQSC